MPSSTAQRPQSSNPAFAKVKTDVLSPLAGAVRSGQMPKIMMRSAELGDTLRAMTPSERIQLCDMIAERYQERFPRVVQPFLTMRTKAEQGLVFSIEAQEWKTLAAAEAAPEDQNACNDQAADMLVRAYDADENTPLYLYEAASLMISTGRTEEASQHLDTLYQQDMNLPARERTFACQMLMFALRDLGKYAQAHEVFEGALKLGVRPTKGMNDLHRTLNP